MTNSYETNHQGCGVVASSFDIRDYKITSMSDLPDEFSTRKVPVKNQYFNSSCVAFALSTVIEHHYAKLTNSNKRFSTEFIYGYRESNYYIGDGMVIRDALKTIKKYGDPFQADCTGNNKYDKAMENINENVDKLKELAYPHRISAYVKLETAEQMKTAIFTNGPIVVSMNWYDDYVLENNIYTYCPSKEYGRHCVVIYGWNKDGWLVQNSWGVTFGNGGRFIVPYSFKFNEAWGIIDDIDDNRFDVVTPSENKFIKKIYKAINNVVNFVKNLFKKDK